MVFLNFLNHIFSSDALNALHLNRVRGFFYALKHRICSAEAQPEEAPKAAEICQKRTMFS